MSKKDLAVSFLKMAGLGDVRAAFDKFTAANFIHHNQYFKGDRESLMLAMEEASRTSPNGAVDIKYVYEDGNTVITHSHVTRKDPAAQGFAVVHIFRFENDRVVELWDLGQLIEKDSPNENGLF